MLDPDNGYKGFTENSRWYKVGGPLYNAFRHKYAGVNENGEALYYVDSSLDGKTDRPGTLTDQVTTNPNDATKYELGSMLPKLFGGLSTDLRVGNFDFSATFDYQLGGKMYDTRYAGFMGPWENTGAAGSTFHKDWKKAWSVNNTSSSIPRWYYGDQYSTGDSDRWLTSSSYLNFQSFTVGYTLGILSKASPRQESMRQARTFGSGQPEKVLILVTLTQRIPQSLSTHQSALFQQVFS